MGTATAIIPARYDSVRFPGKPLANKTGKPLIQHVYERVGLAKGIGRIVVATDDERIEAAVRAFDGDVVMTRRDHENGTSRIAEAVGLIDSPGELVINVQGDEPEIEPVVIEAGLAQMSNDPNAPMGTCASPFAADENPIDPNIVKVVVDRASRAMYFSRSLIPFNRDDEADSRPLKHVGLYFYRTAFLQTYIGLEPTAMEQAERLEQLRVLEHGHAITVAIVESHHHGIDTPQQYESFVSRQMNRR